MFFLSLNLKDKYNLGVIEEWGSRFFIIIELNICKICLEEVRKLSQRKKGLSQDRWGLGYYRKLVFILLDNGELKKVLVLRVM